MKKIKIFVIALISCCLFILTACDDDWNYSDTNSDQSSDTSYDDGGTSYNDYVFYKSVRALKIVSVGSSESTSYEYVDVYKKNSKYYVKKTGDYCLAHHNYNSTFLGVSVSSYDYWSLHVSSLDNYYYYDL